MARRYLSVIEAEAAFWDRVEPVTESGCWIWTGSLDRAGYGSMYWKGRLVGTHRLAWELTFGEPKADEWVLHHCDVRCCVNPKHLFLGTHVMNMADMAKKGRRKGIVSIFGEDHPIAKLTPEDVSSLRAEYEAGNVSQKKLAEKYGVGQMTISRAVRGETWRHI